MKNKHLFISFICSAVVVLLLASCNPSRKLKEGEFLLDRNYVIDKDTKIEKSDIENYIKQKPNRKIFVLFRFHLWLYNLANENNIKRKRERYNKKLEKKNAKRIKKGKAAKKNDKQLVGEWLLNIGESPVKLDTLLTQKSSKQIQLFLQNKGFFINTVSDSTIYRRGKKATVIYKIKADAPYTINKLEYKIADDTLKKFVITDSIHTLLAKGENYDVDLLQQERDRITTELNNNGYYLFTKDFIFYEIDTTIGNKKVNINLGIKNFVQRINDYTDSTTETTHQRFNIGDIYVQPDFTSKKTDLSLKKDTLFIDDYKILHTSKLKYKTRVLLNAIFIRKGELYQLKNVENTYRKLSELKSFKTINIFFTPNGENTLDCYVQLSPVLKQSFTIETEGTNRSGNLGISGSVVFQNKNMFKGAEVFELQLKGGIEAQRTFVDNSTTNVTSTIQQLNTIEFGPELNLYVPRFLLPFKTNNAKRSNPKTTFTSAFNFQKRPDYTRNILNFSFGYNWKSSEKVTHTLKPIELSFVKVELSEKFQKYLTETVQNAFILNSFVNHLTPTTKYSFVFNNQNAKKQKRFSYFNLNLESSGNSLRAFYNAVNSIKSDTYKEDEQGRYTVLGIAYSQYLRMDVDYRYYYSSSEINKVVFRIAGGIGKPLTNFNILPFERTFFSGGANGIRAWQARTLGPGSYADSSAFLWNFGDGQLEANIEYRLKMFKIINGALFIDAGNVWLRHPDPKRPGGDFQFNRFYKEIAIGTGFGIRADFSFFIIRFDTGIKVRDPQFLENDRWVLNHIFDRKWKDDYNESHQKKYNFFSFNIGIGYPF